MNKKCFKCGSVKKITEFYRHARMSDGRLNKCIECCKIDVRNNYEKNREHFKNYEISRRDDENRKEKRRLHSKYIRENEKERYQHYQRNYRKKKKASSALLYSVSKGFINRLPCAVCGDKKVEGHHKDYSKPLDVVWLCKIHHAMAHRKCDKLEV